MRITNINFNADTNLGLQDIKMDRLGQVVVLAGPNGSGKSRLLEKLATEVPKKVKQSVYQNNERNLIAVSNALKTQEQHLLKIKGNPSLKAQIDSIQGTINSYKIQLAQINNILKNDKIVTTPPFSQSYQFINFTPPQNSQLTDSHSLNKAQLLQHRNSINTLGIQRAGQAAIPLIQSIQNQWFEATHQNSQLPDDEKQEIIDKYEKLKEFIKLFLGTSIERDKESDATLFGLRAGAAKLSEGQKLLLQFCITLYAQESKLSEIIIWMDEPEKHLHPAALLQVIDKLTSVLVNGQVWIATHNVNLLSHVPTTSIWYMEKGSVSYSGNKPERVLRGLLGDDEAIAKLSSFMTLPEQMAGNQFAFECLFPPMTLETGSDDPQTTQITSSINDLKEENKIIKILDFGAGKGRLLSTINEIEQDSEVKVSDWLDYVALDLPDGDQDICCSHIDTTYGDHSKRYYTDEQSLKEEHSKNSVDVIVLCNVFHEIDPRDWLKLFSDHGAIRYLLKEDGVLLIVEDQHIPYGEKAYNNGFLVLDILQFQELLQIDSYEHTEKRNGRLRAHRIPANKLGNINRDTRISAINSMLATSKEKIREIRNSPNPDFKSGQLHAFWSQQLTNATLALEELEG